MKSEKVLARSLQVGEKIGVFSPGAPVRSEYVAAGAAFLKAAGYGLRAAPGLMDRQHHIAGSPDSRWRDLKYLLSDENIRAVFAARGGFGAQYLLDIIDYSLVRCRPRIILGFSDFTVLQMAIWRHSRLVTFSGPMVAVEMARPGAVNERLLWPLLNGASLEKISAEMSRYFAAAGEVLRPRDFSGVALGGNLSMLAALAGTPYLPDFGAKIIFIEECNEKLYRIDRSLMQLRQAGVFSSPVAVVCGSFSGPDEERSELGFFLRDFFSSDSFPVVLDFAYGHIAKSFILPQGGELAFRVKKKRIELLAPVVC